MGPVKSMEPPSIRSHLMLCYYLVITWLVLMPLALLCLLYFTQSSIELALLAHMMTSPAFHDSQYLKANKHPDQPIGILPNFGEGSEVPAVALAEYCCSYVL